MTNTTVGKLEPGEAFDMDGKREILVMLKNTIPGDLRCIAFSNGGLRILRPERSVMKLDLLEVQNYWE